jgi:prepilin-type N-terminal cleavage/methylation domain-containing protein
MKDRIQPQRGFTMLEMLVAMGIFLLICAAMFELLNLSQQKYNSETQLTAVYQDSRLAMDQIVRDVNASGYPSETLFSPIPTAQPWRYAVGPVAWSPNYPASPCLIGTGGGGTCATPGDYDLIVETRLSTASSADPPVSWIWYHLNGTTLYRTVVQKATGDPLSTVTSSAAQVAFLSNVVNNPGATQLAQITAQYPSMFPGGQPQPIFQYSCETPAGAAPCPTAGAYNAPQYIRDVDVTLVVMTPQADSQTHQLKLVELFGRGHGANPVN